jgi:hypothetical protein
LHRLSEGPIVTYNNLFLAAAISSPNHPVWQWLAKRRGRIAGLRLRLRLGGHLDLVLNHGVTQNAVQVSEWIQPLQTLTAIPGTQLRIEWLGSIADLKHHCIDQWLKPHGQLIGHLTVAVYVNEPRLTLREFAEAAASCRSMDLTIQQPSSQAVNLADLAPVAGSLRSLACGFSSLLYGCVSGVSAFNSMSHLTALSLVYEDVGSEDPWDTLALLTSLQELRLTVSARGDPSLLSALTKLSSLRLESLDSHAHAPFSFSSLQPLSTLQQLEELHLGDRACAATSLQGLSGLSNLTRLVLDAVAYDGTVRSLEGISPRVEELFLGMASGLTSLAGIEGCMSMETLIVKDCGVASLRHLRGLNSMVQLSVSGGCLTSLEGLPSMSLQSLYLSGCKSLTQMSGVEQLSALKTLELVQCGVTSLQPLSQLGEGLQKLVVNGCMSVQEFTLELPHVQPSATVLIHESKVWDVVLAGGARTVAWPSAYH